MIAISVDSPGKLTIKPDTSTRPERDEVLVRVRRAGICGSDVHILEGNNPFVHYPRIIGHEIAGEVEALGAQVDGLQIGDRVVIDPVVSCGICYACRIGRHNVCADLAVLGVHRDGGFKSHFLVPAGNVVAVPAELDLGIAALAEPFSIAANVLSLTGCSDADCVLVYGAGPIGLTVLQVAKLKGARCIVVDIDMARLEAARSFGADRVIHSLSEAVPNAVSSENDGLGPTVVIDAAGVPSLMAEALSIASPAGRIGLLGFSTRPTEIVQKDIVAKELAIYGSRLNRKLVPEVVDWMASGALQPQSMISHTYEAEDADAAFALIRENPSSTIKVQLKF
uniref:Zn-dependent oxidoreductase n=1 Tax=Pararhizobium sp. IMCC3301 TaxID=3067904 RepID=UPI002741F8A7|nr:Zn-dependent oxidoreductase [Pararhizobium sp. IMCC3301]